MYDDYNVDYDEWRKEYAECHDDERVLNSADVDSSFYAWVWDCLNEDWEALLSNIHYSKIDGECVILGSLGLWNGRHDVGAVKANSLIEAIKKCVGSSAYTIIKLVDGHLNITSIHHDGCNYFDIYLLNKLGQTTNGANLTKEVYYKKIKINDIY